MGSRAGMRQEGGDQKLEIETLVELIRRASTDLPADIEAALREAQASEEPGSPAADALGAILENVALARANSTPICQDTGALIFHVHHPQRASTRELRAQIEAAVAEATRRAYLRPNAVDPLTGCNSGNNLGAGFPTLHFEEWDEERLQIDLLLKGGGSENTSAQYALPYTFPQPSPHPSTPPLDLLGGRLRTGAEGTEGGIEWKAGRDLEGVRRVVLDAVHRAQGKGCAPGILGIAIGGDRSTGCEHAKRQLLRPLDDVNRVKELAILEERLLRECNELGIGPMGFGGNTTVLGVKIGVLHRLPACYFVSVATMCWACRRARMTVNRWQATT
jgi:fumarate hydratase class I